MAGDSTDTGTVGSTPPTVTLPAERAIQLAGITRRQLLYWQDAGLIVPAAQHRFSPRNTVRLYEFGELVELLVAAQLRKRCSLQQLRKVVGYLRQQGYQAPLRELRFAIADERIYFQHPDGSWEGDRRRGQVVWEVTIKLEPIVSRIQQAAQRDPAAVGQITKRRGVLGGKETFAGTRVPVATVLRYLEDGSSTQEILEAFPALSEADVETARARLAQGAA